MSERPEQRPEGALISRAQKWAKISQRKAAREAGISEARWRNIVSGYQSVGAGTYVPVRGPAETVARMAMVVGVSPRQLEDAGREDAAQAMREQIQADAEEAREDLDPATRELLDRIRADPKKRERLLEAILTVYGFRPDDQADNENHRGHQAS